ncbi:hypothetical protein ACSS6W_004442 [Trichoderma asperelloides]
MDLVMAVTRYKEATPTFMALPTPENWAGKGRKKQALRKFEHDDVCGGLRDARCAEHRE